MSANLNSVQNKIAQAFARARVIDGGVYQRPMQNRCDSISKRCLRLSASPEAIQIFVKASQTDSSFLFFCPTRFVAWYTLSACVDKNILDYLFLYKKGSFLRNVECIFVDQVYTRQINFQVFFLPRPERCNLIFAREENT